MKQTTKNFIVNIVIFGIILIHISSLTLNAETATKKVLNLNNISLGPKRPIAILSLLTERNVLKRNYKIIKEKHIKNEKISDKLSEIENSILEKTFSRVFLPQEFSGIQKKIETTGIKIINIDKKKGSIEVRGDIEQLINVYEILINNLQERMKNRKQK